MKKIICSIVLFLLVFNMSSAGQSQYKLSQSRNIMGMKVESTVYVKGMRKRTETAGMMGMSGSTEIQQCDLKRTIKINDKKKLYYIEPFAKEEEVTDEDEKNTKTAASTTKPSTVSTKGGTIYLYHNITDTGERKKMYGMVARHVWTTMKIKPSADACTMKDSMIMKTDGWYIDLPEFNCPVNYKPGLGGMPQQEKPSCIDKFVSKKSGKGKLGFPLQETTTMIMGDGQGKTSEFTTNLETLEFSTAKLDSSLFTIPAGYTETKSEADLQDKFDMKAAMNEAKKTTPNTFEPPVTNENPAGKIRVAVYQPKGEGVNAVELQKYLVSILASGKIQAVAASSEEEAKKLNCDYSLNTEFIRIKQGGKVGGFIKAIKNADPNAATSFTIENEMILKKLDDGSVRLQKKIEGKYDGKLDDAAKRSLDEESSLVLTTIN